MASRQRRPMHPVAACRVSAARPHAAAPSRVADRAQNSAHRSAQGTADSPNRSGVAAATRCPPPAPAMARAIAARMRSARNGDRMSPRSRMAMPGVCSANRRARDRATSERHARSPHLRALPPPTRDQYQQQHQSCQQCDQCGSQIVPHGRPNPKKQPALAPKNQHYDEKSIVSHGGILERNRIDGRGRPPVPIRARRRAKYIAARSGGTGGRRRNYPARGAAGCAEGVSGDGWCRHRRSDRLTEGGRKRFGALGRWKTAWSQQGLLASAAA